MTMLQIILISFLSLYCSIVACETKKLDELDKVILDEMSIGDSDVRISGLKAIKATNSISDDEFSSRLVHIAESLTGKEEYLEVRSFTVASLMRFGTTNALDFLENELNNGFLRSHQGICGYVLVTGFDERSFEFIEKITKDKSLENCRNRESVYYILSGLMNSGNEYYGRKVTDANRQLAMEFIRKSIKDEFIVPIILDRILCEHDAEYVLSEERRRHAALVLLNTNANDYAKKYFSFQMRKIVEGQPEVQSNDTELDSTNVDECGADNRRGAFSDNAWPRVVCMSLVVLAIVAIGIRITEQCRSGRDKQGV